MSGIEMAARMAAAFERDNDLPTEDRSMDLDDRPDVCRNLEIGGEGCLEWRRVFRIGKPPAKKFQLRGGRLVEV